jgi:hypothetical protein
LTFRSAALDAWCDSTSCVLFDSIGNVLDLILRVLPCIFGHQDAYHANNEYAQISEFAQGARVIFNVIHLLHNPALLKKE